MGDGGRGSRERGHRSLLSVGCGTLLMRLCGREKNGR